jgi:alpha-glucosidase
MSVTCEMLPDHAHLAVHIGRHEGRYPAWWRKIAVEVNGISRKPSSVTIDGHAATFSVGDHSVIVTTIDQGKGMNIVIPLDLAGS